MDSQRKWTVNGNYGIWVMNKVLVNIWAKASKDDEARWHPLILHMLDVAASADAILAREPESTRKRMAAILGLDWEDARAWILLLIACLIWEKPVRVFSVSGRAHLNSLH